MSKNLLSMSLALVVITLFIASMIFKPLFLIMTLIGLFAIITGFIRVLLDSLNDK